jgi:hypothetical protein
MKTTTIDNIPFELDESQVFKALHVGSDSDYAETVRALIKEAQNIGKPRVVYGEAYVEEKGEDFAIVDGIRFSSRVLRVNLSDAYRVFPYVATCGSELEAWAASVGDMLASFWADGIMQMALGPAREAVMRRIDEEFHPGKTSTMNPGSLSDWPIEEQRPLFTLLGDVEGAIGVRLTESCLMLPKKSVSGMRFPSETNYENCQLCPREVCPGRRAPYDKNLYDAKYRQRAG